MLRIAAFSVLGLLSLNALALPQTSGPPAPPVCTDGGQLHCCQATFSGGLLPIVLAADLACYDLTPAVVNCIITDAPIDPETGCMGTYSCCQVNDFAPVLGLFCSKPPGDCVDSEGDGRCTDLITGRFNCTDGDRERVREDLESLGGTLTGLLS
ncbi:hypothetical protein M409DRAFT_25609 [Zasmidium cellare ATCC 36951]|uniref:Hydrophobin n=1 Tax=Zasmidium cellare ATCC 36951 TaxID=1080233 RepID=A0A6A6CFS9_ZASCE|nr:uncharacterized protein M409DRAFT_25609 [Zasmidium cellare ATCC 36951]KAF2164266.1 hypothetical protein M409DRAFT_25609 [Zasmidium cellare ATCC 36951]